MKFADAIKRARKAAGLTQEALSQRLNWRQSRLSNYETGKREPGQDELNEIARSLGIELQDLLGFNVAEPSASYGPKIRGYVPLISWVKAGDWAEAIDLFEPGHSESAHPTTVPHGPQTFALRVEGDSMTAPPGSQGHSFPNGMIIYVDPDKRGSVSTGDYVVAKHNGHGHVTFKQLANEEGRSVLKPLNTNGQYPIIRDEFEIIGKVIDAGWGGL